MPPTSIYIHIPFCKTRCGYCDFLTFANHSHQHEAYKNALIREITASKQTTTAHTINTIFIGGGTPTVLPPSYIAQILSAVSNTYHIARDAEITIEANPGTLSLDTLRTLKASGINRLSIGLQTWQNEALASIGRSHTIQDFLTNYNHARSVGYNNINVDLIFSLPLLNGQVISANDHIVSKTNDKLYMHKQTTDPIHNWHTTLQNITNLSPDHISVYSLILEENTPFFKAYENGILTPQSPELDRQMYHHAINHLSTNGYTHYEISNFAKPNKQCRHNLTYWQRGQYLAFGLGAHGFVNNTRTGNITDLPTYIQTLASSAYTPGDAIQERTHITTKDAMEEFMFLGLRCIDGVDKLRFFHSFSQVIHNVFGNAIESNIKKGLLQENSTKIALTSKGLDISNTVMADFLLDTYEE